MRSSLHLSEIGSPCFAQLTLFAVAVAAPALGSEPAAIGSKCTVLDSSIDEGDTLAERVWIRSDGLGVGLGLVLFCFGGHATFPEIYSQMSAEERPHFDKAINAGFAAAAAFFTLLGAISYHYYGDCAADTLTLNLMHTSPLLGRVATVCVLANTFFSFPTFCAPVVRILTELVHSSEVVETLEAGIAPPTEEEMFRRAMASRFDALAAKVDAIALAVLQVASNANNANASGGGGGGGSTSHGKSMLPREVAAALRASTAESHGFFSDYTSTSVGTSSPGGGEAAQIEANEPAKVVEEASGLLQAMSWPALFVRIGLVVVAATLAVSVPNFGFVVALMGSFTTMLVSFILPTAFFLIVRWHALSTLRIVLCIGVLLIGFAGMAVGLTNTLRGD